MFGSTSNPFGQSSSSPFGSPSGFGQTSNASNNNPFAPKPFGTNTPFGAQTGASLFGGTSTGVFGAATQSPSPFGASSSPAFGSSTPTFGASTSTPAFGSSSSPFGGSSVFGQKPSFGAFGSSTPTQPSPFGSTAQPSQPAFGSSLFGSSAPFGASSQPAFGASSQPAFGASSQPAFGASTQPAFGSTSTPAFGAPTTSTFGSSSTQPFSTGAAVGSSLFGSGGGFGTSSTPAFGASTTPAFGATTASAFGAASTPAFSFGSSPAFGQSASAFGSSPFGASTTPSPFGAQSSMFGAQSTTPAFGNTGFGQTGFGGAQRGGSRVAPYVPTTEPDANNTGAAGKLESISAMPVYKDKSHEELRWEDYQLGDKGGPMPAAPSSGINFNTPASQPSVLNATPAFGQTSSSLFSNPISSNIFAPKNPTPTPTFNTAGFGPVSSSSPSLFNSSSTPSLFSTTSAAFPNTSSSIFPTTSPSFAPPAFSPQVPGSTSAFGTSTLFPNVTPPGQTGGAFGQTTAAFGPGTTPSFTQPNLFTSPSTGFPSNFSTTPSLAVSTNPTFNHTTPSFPGLFSASQPAQQPSNSFSIFPASQPANSGGAGMGMFGNLSVTQNPAVVQPVPASNPFGTLPAMPRMSIGREGTTPSVQYGISSMPVSDKVAPVRISSFLTSRHLSQRRIRLPARKYNPKTDGTKVPFFSDDDETASTPKADALFLPRENPRALVIRPADQWPPKSSADKPSPFKDSTPMLEDGKVSGQAHPASNGFHSEDKNKDQLGDDAVTQVKQKGGSVKTNQKANGVHDDHAVQKEDSYMTLSGHRAGEAAIVYEHGAGIEALMPKLRRSDYYTEPRIQELAAKERAEPGFCCRVKDFVVGRHGYGSIKFFGETDVRRLDLESLVQFNNREVIVYMDDSKKPPVGQGLNKPAEVTLLNIKCFDKKTGRHITEGPKIEKYTEMLKRKAKDQGAEFVSYAPANGEWKFRVDHFSGYKLTEEDEEEVGFDVED